MRGRARGALIVAATALGALVASAWLAGDGEGAARVAAVEDRPADDVGALSATLTSPDDFVHAPARAPVAEEVPAAGERQLAVLDVTVVDGTGAALPGSRVLVPPWQRTWAVPPSGQRVRLDALGARTDREGRVALEVGAGEQVRLIGAWGDERASLELDPLRGGTRTAVELSFASVLPRSFVGRVTDSVTGEPVVSSEVRLRVTKPFAEPLVVATDALGELRLQRIGSRLRQLEVSAPGYRPKTLDLESGRDRDDEGPAVESELEQSITVALEPCATLVVRVVDPDGTAVPGADVAVRRRIADAGPWESGVETLRGAASVDGTCVLDDVLATVDLGLELRGEDELLALAPEVLHLARGEVRRVELRVGGSGEVRGALLDQHGRPIADHPVGLFVPDGPQRGVARDDEPSVRTATDADGTFSLRAVAGLWRVGALTQGDVAGWQASALVAEGAAADVAPRADRGLSVAGRVVGEGRGVVDTFSVVAGGSRWRVDTRGEFRIEPAHAGRLELRLESQIWPVESAPMAIETGESEVTIVLEGDMRQWRASLGR